MAVSVSQDKRPAETIPREVDHDLASARVYRARCVGDLGPGEIRIVWRFLTTRWLFSHHQSAGERFREQYYWDTFWVIRGLIVCGMDQTAADLVRNLVYMVEQFGHIPNGSRQYYANRSQPPLLSMMIKEILKSVGTPPDIK